MNFPLTGSLRCFGCVREPDFSWWGQASLDFSKKSIRSSSATPGWAVRQMAIRIGDTGSLSLISILSEIVQEISTGSLVGRFESGISDVED